MRLITVLCDDDVSFCEFLFLCFYVCVCAYVCASVCLCLFVFVCVCVFACVRMRDTRGGGVESPKKEEKAER